MPPGTKSQDGTSGRKRLGADEEGGSCTEAGGDCEGVRDWNTDQAGAGASHTLSQALPNARGDVDITMSSYSPSGTIHVKTANIT
jgi:hypothetical protein